MEYIKSEKMGSFRRRGANSNYTGKKNPLRSRAVSRMTAAREEMRKEMDTFWGTVKFLTRHFFALLVHLANPRVTGNRRRCFGYGAVWIWQAFRLVLFACCLMPAFVRIGYYYIKSDRVKKGISYGKASRQNLDIYLPEGLGVSDDGRTPTSPIRVPVLVFVPGGAWLIGHKCWAALMGKVLAEHGVMVVVPDYRNFPQARVGEMLEDVDASVGWVFKHIKKYGGDTSRIFLSGQSAGAHLSSLSLLSHCDSATGRRIRRATSACTPQGFELDASSRRLRTSWKTSQLAGFIGISGPYDLIAMAPHIHKRGLSTSVMHSIFKLPVIDIETDDDILFDASSLPPSSFMEAPDYAETARRLVSCSPTRLIQRMKTRPMQAASLAAQLPRITMLHGTADATCPHFLAVEFRDAVLSACPDHYCELRLYEGKTHTSPILEDPISGYDPLVSDILEVIRGHTLENSADGVPLYRRNSLASQTALAPKWCVSLARAISPF